MDEPLLVAERLTRHFGGLTAVDAVSLGFSVGEVHAVIGTNGAGKSTLVHMLSGELPASDGRYTWRNAGNPASKPRQALRRWGFLWPATEPSRPDVFPQHRRAAGHAHAA